MKRHNTFSPKAADIEREWWLVDATDLPLGRLASETARLIMGKHRPTYAPHVDCGDHVVVINAEKVGVTGKKETDKMYYRHSNYPGGLTTESLEQVRARKPEMIIEQAVRGMLPKNRLGRKMALKLKVYAGPDHPHTGQGPKPLDLNLRKVNT
ncbi:MAG: 50S ribosomal protein L13 [Acidimicrobiia bacterium]|nr:50S ribosomal protein L13 [Acidimicrobiia bacterium]